MCEACHPDRDFTLDSPEIREAARAVYDVYCFNGAGGAMHVVVDDWNVEDHDIDWCLDNAHRYAGGPTVSEQALEIYAGLALRALPTIDERLSALKMQEGWP